MKKAVRYIGSCAREKKPMVLVTTRHSLWNPALWFGSTPMKRTKVYRYDEGAWYDFDGYRAPIADSRAINAKLVELGIEL